MGNFLKMKHIFRTNKASPTGKEAPTRRGHILKQIKRRTGKTIREIFRKEAKPDNPQCPDGESAAYHDVEQTAEESLQQPQFAGDNDAAYPNTEGSAEEIVQQSQSETTNNAAYNDAEQPTKELVQHSQCDDSSDAAPNDAEQTVAEFIQPAPRDNSNETAHHDTEPFVEVSTQQTPKAVGNDSGYNSPQDETSAWEKILEMREREHQNDLAAMQDVHDDEMKDLRKELSSEIGKKQLLQTRVKKEVLAKQDLKQQLDTLHEEHGAVVEASECKDKDIEEKEKEILALRAHFQEVETRYHNKEESYLETIKIQGEVMKAKEGEVVDLRLRIYELNTELLRKEESNQGALSEVGTNALNLQSREHAAIAQWKTWYHQAFEEAHGMRKQLAICANQREQAMEFAQDFQAQLELAKSANVKLSAEVASKQQQIEVDGRYHEQIRGQNYDLQKRVNESIAAVAQLKYKKVKAEQEAAEDVKDLTRKLDNRTAELSALEATRAEWQADPEGVLLTPFGDVDTKALILALAKRFQLALNENDDLKQRMSVREQDYDALNKKLRHMKAQRDGLSELLAGKAEEVTSLKDKIHELETIILSREMDEETEKQAEPLYLQAMEEVAQKEVYISQCLEEIQRLKEAVSENEEDVDSRALVAQRDQARREALQNRQQHVAKVEKLKDLIEKVHQRMLQLEATLAVAGRTIEEPNNEGETLKAQCARVLGYDGAESESEYGSPIRTPSEPVTGNLANAEPESDEARNLPEPGPNTDNANSDVASRANNAASDTNLDDSPTNQAEQESNDQSEAATERSSESSTTITVRRFVMRALAEGGTRTRVLGEPSSPAAPPTPAISTPAVPTTQVINPSTEGDVQDIPSDDTANRSEDDQSGDLQPYHPPPLPVASLAWMERNRPFAYGEPVGDDQFGKEALQTRR